MTEPLTRVARYERTVPVSTDRVWENVRDWEHLPWLHRTSFSSIELREEGDWGWRARIGLQPAALERSIELELVIAKDAPRYVSRTVKGPGAGSEIWTTVSGRGPDASDIAVEFLVPGVDPARADAVGVGFVEAYTRLWDEDEGMMSERRDQLRARRGPAAPAELELGPLAELRARLPLVVALGGRRFRLLELDGELIAHSTVCAHLLGPLREAPVEEGCVTCPWHGYRYDLRTVRSADGRRLRLAPAPRVEVDAESGQVRLVSAQ